MPLLYLILALPLIAAQGYLLPLSSSDPNSQATAVATLVALALIFFLVVGRVLSESVDKAINDRLPLQLAFAILLTLLMFTPTWYYFHVAAAQFRAYPATRALPFEAALVDDPASLGPALALISDTHITDRKATLENQYNGPSKLRRTFALMNSVGPTVSIVAGDLTDRGAQSEWQLFASLLGEYNRRRRAIDGGAVTLLVPGNHDLQGSPFDQRKEVVNRSSGVVDRHVFTVPYLVRERRFAELVNEGGGFGVGAGAFFAANFSKRVGEIENDAAKMKFQAIMLPTSRGGEQDVRYIANYPLGFEEKVGQAEELFVSRFPVLHEDVGTGIGLALLDSSTRISPGASMGLGSLGRPQLQRLDAYLEALVASDRPIRSLVVVLHHAPVRREADIWSMSELARKRGYSDVWAHTFLALDARDAQELVAILKKHARARSNRSNIQFVLAYGHRHARPYLGRVEPEGVVTVLEVPSVIEQEPPGFWAAYAGSNGLTFKWLTTAP